jgi:hypothetical protein
MHRKIFLAGGTKEACRGDMQLLVRTRGWRKIYCQTAHSAFITLDDALTVLKS